MLIKWKIRAFLYDTWFGCTTAITDFVKDVVYMVRKILYLILSIAYRIGIVGFLVSFYYMYTYYNERNADDIKYAVVLFIAPIVIAILKEWVRPKYSR